MIWFILLLARICGKLLGVFARTQTRLLTRAQSLGWIPTDQEARRLLKRQRDLFKYEMSKIEMRKRKL